MNITKAGRTFRVDIVDDSDADAPWESDCGHGVVSEWTRRAKKPGEWVLNADHGSCRYYDAKASLELALKDGWGMPGEWHEAHPGSTKLQIAAAAFEKDFEFLRGWCNDEWRYVGVVVTDITDDENAKIDYSNALWGIESDNPTYHEQVAFELIENYLAEHADEFALQARQNAARAAFDARVGTGAYDAYHRLQSALKACVETGLASVATTANGPTVVIYSHKPEDA